MNRSKSAARVLAFALPAALGLAACSSFGGQQSTYTCPVATTVRDIQAIAQLGGANSDIVQSAGKISAVHSSCGKEKAGIKADLSIDFTALRSTFGVTHVDLPYFVAIADSTGNILGKQQFSVGVDFPAGAPMAATTEKITAHLPLANPQLGNVYTIIVGFQLTQKELDFNRAHLQ